MKKLYSLFFFLAAWMFVQAGQYVPQRDALPENNFSACFEKAYLQHPEIPRGVLEAVAYTNSRFNHITHNDAEEGSCMGLPKYYGVMGLVADGENYFQTNLHTVAALSRFTQDEIISSPEKNILAYADAYEQTQKYLLVGSKIENQVPVLVFLSEIPDEGLLGNNYAMNTHLYSALSFLNNNECAAKYNFPQYNIDLAKIFGEEKLKVLSSSYVTVSPEKISDKKGNEFKGATLPVSMSPDRKSTRLNSSHSAKSRMPSSA